MYRKTKNFFHSCVGIGVCILRCAEPPCQVFTLLLPCPAEVGERKSPQLQKAKVKEEGSFPSRLFRNPICLSISRNKKKIVQKNSKCNCGVKHLEMK